MRNLKKLCVGALTGAMLLSMTFSHVMAEEAFDHVIVEGVQVTAENAADILGDGTAAYDPDTDTLTLKNANISVEKGTDGINYGIYAKGNLNIVLEGTNTVICEDYYGIAISDPAGANSINATITGDGSLEASGTDIGIWVRGNLLIEDSVQVKGICGDVASGSAYGIRADGTLTIGGDATVETFAGSAPGDCFSLYGKAAFKIKDNATVIANASCAGSRSCGVYAYRTLEIGDNAKVYATGGADGTEQSYGIRTTNMYVTGGIIEAKASEAKNESFGIYTQTLDVTGGTIDMEGGASSAGQSGGLFANISLTVSGGVVNATGGTSVDDSIGLYVPGTIAIAGGTVNASSGDGDRTYGIETNTLTIADGDVTVKALAADSQSRGIFSANDMEISGGTITVEVSGAENRSYGVQSGTVIDILGGELKVSVGEAAKSYGIYAGDTVHIKDAAVEVTSRDYGIYARNAKNIDNSETTDVYVEHGKETFILYTNDVHCAIDDYSELAAYAAQLENEGHDVLIVDAGDAIQGELIGTITEGSAIIDIMNEVGYDFAVPGNHEFDYGMDTFLNIADNESKFEYLCSNFIDLRTNDTVFHPYKIVNLDGEEIAIIGISTPESYTKSTPAYFQDENGNVIYSFAQTDFYNTIQKTIDSAVAEGAQRVIVVGHLGIDGTTDGWKSTDVIANTTGIDVFIDAHSHEVIEGSYFEDKSGNEVLLSSTGTKFAYFGELTLEDNSVEKTKLIRPESVDENSSEAAKAAYDAVQTKVDVCNEQIEYYYGVLGSAEVELTLNNPDTGEWVIRKQETNMGDFVADAYRETTGADISLMNSGGIRAAIEAGDVTRKAIMDVNPWNNEMCVVNATGQQILDALEHGARLYPETSGGFLQVSGLTYEIHAYVESPVAVDEYGSFQSIDENKERRVKNVKVNGETIDPDKTYTVAASYYMLKQGGDGFTMFADSEVLKHEELPNDAEMLIQYFTENLKGKVTKEQYGNLKGEGRIKIYASEAEIPGEENGSEAGSDDIAAKTGDENVVLFYMTLMVVAFAAGVSSKSSYCKALIRMNLLLSKER